MGTHPRLKAWHGILVAVFILGLVAGAHFWGSASAQDGTGAIADSSTVVAPPEDTSTRDVIAVEGGAVDVSAGVTVGTNRPAASPGTPSQPVPQFSAVNTPVWVNSQGPAQIVDDLIVYGLTEVKGGLINNGGGAQIVAPPAPEPQPELTIATDLSTPAGVPVNQGTNGYHVATMQFTATGAAATVSAIKMIAAGSSTPLSDFANVSLYDGGALIGGPTSAFDAAKKITFSGLNLTIEPGTPKILTVKTDIKPTAGATNTFQFGIANGGDVTSSDSTPTGTVVGGVFTIRLVPPALVFDMASYAVNEPDNPSVVATLTALSLNTDGTRAETATINVFSDKDPAGFSVTLKETGADTGIFSGTFSLGVSASAGVLVVNCGNDRITGARPGTAATATVTATCLPDLQVTSITPPSAAAQAGNLLSFSGVVSNTGGAGSGASQARLRIDIDNNGTWDVMPANVATAGLAAGATVNASWNNAWTATAGTHKFEICADAGSAVAESNEANNCPALQIFSVAAAPAAPTLAVAIAADTPPAQSVQAGTNNITTTKFALTAANGNINVTDIKITRNGTAGDADLLNVKLFDGAAQLGNTATLSGGKATFSGLNLAVANGATKTLLIKTDVKGSAVAGTTFALGVAATTDITATTASGAATVSGPTPAAPGNTFTVSAPPTLTLTRANTPAPGLALITGTNVTLLEFDAQMNSGSVNLKTLFVVPKNGKSGTITNLKLINSTTGATLDSAADSATVRGQDAYFFDVTATPPSIGTSATRLKVTGDVVCGSVTVEDHIIEASSDVALVTLPAGGISGPPFATVSRTLTACPIPAPTVTYKCSNSKLYADVGWSTLGKGDDTAPTSGFYVDFDNEAVAANAFRTGADQNGFWNTSSNYTTNATFSLNENAKVAPYSLGGYNPGGAAQNSLANLTFGAKYQARIYYPKTGEHSLINAFTAPASCSGYTTFSITDFSAPIDFSAPSFGGGTVEFGFPSVLHGDFGSFIPQANAGFIEIAQAQVAPPPVHPVYIYDDLYVYGNSVEEPGNIYLKGQIFGAPGTDAINMSSNLQLTANLNVLGTTAVATLNVANGAAVSNGLTVSSGDLDVTVGIIKATAIGAYYKVSKSIIPLLGGAQTVQATCGTKDILISCSGNFVGEGFTGTAMAGSSCTAYGNKTTINKTTLTAQAVCFNPDRSAPSGFTGTMVNL